MPARPSDPRCSRSLVLPGGAVGRELFLPPRKGREHGLRVLREVLAFEAHGKGTRINQALEFLQRVVTKRAVVFLVSDFFDDGYERTLRVAARKHDMVAISVEDPRESQLPPVGLIAVIDPETEQPGVIDASSAHVRRRYADFAAAARQRKKDVLRRCGVELLELSTGVPYEPPFVRFFRERARRVMRSGG